MAFLGQHFLINKAAITKIISSLNLQKNDTVIEIGPGEGALTLPLLEKCRELGCKLIAVEKDPHLANQLRSYANATVNELEIVTGDALKLLNSPTHQLTNWKLVGNIPYYITGKLLRTLGELETKPALIVLTIQREVAERIVAKPPKMNLLAAATQIWAEAEIIGRLDAKYFNPPPKVDSAIIKLEPRIQNLESRILNDYYRLIKLIFKQPRKTVLNNLSTGLDMNKAGVLEIMKMTGLDGTERPQNLSLETLIKLSTTI